MYSAENKPLCISIVYVTTFCIYNADRATALADPVSCEALRPIGLAGSVRFFKRRDATEGLPHSLSFDGGLCLQNSRQKSGAPISALARSLG